MCMCCFAWFGCFRTGVQTVQIKYTSFSELLCAFRCLTIKLGNLKNGLIKDEKHYQIIWRNIRRGGLHFIQITHESIRSWNVWQMKMNSIKKNAILLHSLDGVDRSKYAKLSLFFGCEWITRNASLFYRHRLNISQKRYSTYSHTAYNSHLNSLFIFHLNVNLICAMVWLNCTHNDDECIVSAMKNEMPEFSIRFFVFYPKFWFLSLVVMMMLLCRCSL